MEAETKKYIDNAFELLDRIGYLVDEFELELAGKCSMETDELHIIIRIPLQQSKEHVDNAFELRDRIGLVVDEFKLELAGKPSMETDELHITIRIPLQKSN